MVVVVVLMLSNNKGANAIAAAGSVLLMLCSISVKLSSVGGVAAGAGPGDVCRWVAQSETARASDRR